MRRTGKYAARSRSTLIFLFLFPYSMSAIAATVPASTVLNADVASVSLKGHGKYILFSADEEKITSLA